MEQTKHMLSRLAVICFVIAAFFVLGAADRSFAASGNTIYVEPSNAAASDDKDNYADGRIYKTLNQAIYSSKDGDVIVVNENVSMTTKAYFNGKSITIKGKNKGIVVSRDFEYGDMIAVASHNDSGAWEKCGLTLEDITLDGKNINVGSFGANETYGTGTAAIASYAGRWGTVRLKDGAVIKNCVGEHALRVDCNFIMEDGSKVINNTSRTAGTIYTRECRDWTLGGEVSGNVTQEDNGGAIYLLGADGVQNNVEITSTAKITNNTVEKGCGGGVYVNQNVTLTMNGGLISGNVAKGTKVLTDRDYGGGGVGIAKGEFIMNGGKITGNTGDYGGGVIMNTYHINNGNFIMNGGTISGNTAKNSHGVDYPGNDVAVVNPAVELARGGVTVNKAAVIGEGFVALPNAYDLSGNNGAAVYPSSKTTTVVEETRTLTGGSPLATIASEALNNADYKTWQQHTSFTTSTDGDSPTGDFKITYPKGTKVQGFDFVVAIQEVKQDGSFGKVSYVVPKKTVNTLDVSYDTGGSNVARNTVLILSKARGIATYTVNYDANGGTGSLNDSNSPYNEFSQVTVLGQTGIERTGYQFTNWNTKADGTGTSYAPGDKFTITTNTTLYAQWQQVPTSNPGGQTNPPADGSGNSGSSADKTPDKHSNPNQEADSDATQTGDDFPMQWAIIVLLAAAGLGLTVFAIGRKAKGK